MTQDNLLIFERSHPGRKGYSLPPCDVEVASLDDLGTPLRDELDLPEVTENEIMRHYLGLSQKNYSIDTGFYPLGSCTMKYNPKINEDVAKMKTLSDVHPYQPEDTIQGSLQMLYELAKDLKEVSGMDAMTLQPAAGAQGELTGLMMIKQYHLSKGNDHKVEIIVPDAAHGTNPATAAMVDFELVEIPSGPNGGVDIEALKGAISENTAGLMLTNPSTIGIFEEHIEEIAALIHEVDGLLYYDGANMNAIMGKARPGDMGFDVMHFNLHKTFSTPHGGGGPGAGPVGVKEHLIPYLPVPIIEEHEGSYRLNYDRDESIGKVKSYYGNYGILLRAYTYIKSLGGEGLQEASEIAVLNANYMMNKLKETYELPYDQVCKHEFVLSHVKGTKGIKTLDIAKRMLDFGVHPPTIYFPLIIDNALMIEPTESEPRERLDHFISVMEQIAKEAKTEPEILAEAPRSTRYGRIDEAYAARALILKYKDIPNE